MKILKFAIFVKKNLKINMLTIKNIVKEHRGNAHSIYNLKYSVSKEVPIVFHNGSNYNYHFIIKKLVEEFEGQFTWLVKNNEKYITFSIPIENKVTRTYKKVKKLQNRIPKITINWKCKIYSKLIFKSL